MLPTALRGPASIAPKHSGKSETCACAFLLRNVISPAALSEWQSDEGVVLVGYLGLERLQRSVSPSGTYKNVGLKWQSTSAAAIR
jgi:hypothetical protein